MCYDFYQLDGKYYRFGNLFNGFLRNLDDVRRIYNGIIANGMIPEENNKYYKNGIPAGDGVV